MRKQTFETFCPLFPGFYGTVFEYEGEENDIGEYNYEHETDYDWDDFDWDYADYHNRVSKAFVNRLGSELQQFLPIKIEFQELYSPKEYNFANDSINVSMELDLNQLIRLIKERSEDAEKYFLDRYTPYSGFIPFHSRWLADWLKPSYILAEPKHRVGALLNCLCSIEFKEEDTFYWTDSEFWIDFSLKETVSQ